MDDLDYAVSQGLQKQKVNPEIEDSLEKRKKALMNSTQVLNQDLGKDTFAPPEASRFNAGLGGPMSGVDSDIYKAVTSRNQARSNDYVSTLKRDNQFMAPVRESEGLRNLGSDMGQVADIGVQNYKINQQQKLNERRLQLYRQQQADSILGGILGIFGTIAGGIIGGLTGGAVGKK